MVAGARIEPGVLPRRLVTDAVGCPVCRAPIGGLCRSPTGELRLGHANHLARVIAAHHALLVPLVPLGDASALARARRRLPAWFWEEYGPAPALEAEFEVVEASCGVRALPLGS